MVQAHAILRAARIIGPPLLSTSLGIAGFPAFIYYVAIPAIQWGWHKIHTTAPLIP